MSLKKDILWRVGVIYFSMLLFALLIIGKVLYLQLFESEEWKNKAQKFALDNREIYPNRGNIYSEGGRLLSTSVPYYEIRMDLMSNALTDEIFYNNVDSLCYNLSKIFHNRTKSQYKVDLLKARKEKKRFHLLKKDVTFNQLKQIRKFPIFRYGKYKGGFIVVESSKRKRPHLNLASRTIGYITKGESGNVVGLEGAYDHYLKGVTGVRLMQRLPGGIWMPVHDGNEIDPKDGKDIVTTLNVNLQDVAENALLKQLIRQGADRGLAILMEVATGEVQAIVNLEKDKNGNYRELYNYALGHKGSIEPGSTFKLPVLMVALEDNCVDLEDIIDTENGVVHYYDKDIRDTKPGGYGKISVQKVFEVSSNVGMSKIITENYKGKEHKFIDRLYEMGLNKRLGIEIKGEGIPDIKYPGDKFWSGISLPMISHGYEVKLTPLQILTFYNAVANDGVMVRPKFVKAIQFRGKNIKTFKTQIINPSICSKSTIRKARKMLEGVVENGTAINLKNTNYKIAGKTGTAQIADEKYGYKDTYQASFVGYFPADSPKYSCIVVVTAPSKSVYYGNLVAGPVFKEIADKVYATGLDMHDKANISVADNTIKIPYSKNGQRTELENLFERLGYAVDSRKVISEWVTTTKKDDCVEFGNRNIVKTLVPNVVEMGLKDALFLLESAGLRVEVKGRGSIQKQSLTPGTRIKHGDKIVLEMSFM